MERRHPHVVNRDELSWDRSETGDRFSVDRKRLGMAAAGEGLGCSLCRVPPGKTAWPRHYHFANEESIYILEGAGCLRIGEERVAVRAGDYIALPTGPALAHQLLNDADAPLTYLCLSTMVDPDVMGYPDSGKVGVMAGSAPGGDADKRSLCKFYRQDDNVPYWHGEA